MSRRPLAQKRRNRLAKMFRATPAGYIDLVEWLRTKPGVNTAGEARMLIKAGAVRYESHTLGVDEVYMAPATDGMVSHMRLHGNPRVPSDLRSGLHVRLSND